MTVAIEAPTGIVGAWIKVFGDEQSDANPADPRDITVQTKPANVSPVRFLTVKEVSVELRTSTKTIYRLLDDGALPAVQFKPGSPYLIEQRELESFIENSRTSSVQDIDPWQ